jgi:hypothetical protein
MQLFGKGYDGRYELDASWAFLKYQVDSDTYARAGRLRMPIFLLSEYLDVGVAYPWVRPPMEVYGLVPFSNFSGVDVTRRMDFFDRDLTVQISYGNTKPLVWSGGKQTTFNGRDALMGQVYLEDDMFRLRLGYAKNVNDFDPDLGLGIVDGAISAMTIPAYVEGAAEKSFRENMEKFVRSGLIQDDDGTFQERMIDQFNILSADKSTANEFLVQFSKSFIAERSSITNGTATINAPYYLYGHDTALHDSLAASNPATGYYSGGVGGDLEHYKAELAAAAVAYDTANGGVGFTNGTAFDDVKTELDKWDIRYNGEFGGAGDGNAVTDYENGLNALGAQLVPNAAQLAAIELRSAFEHYIAAEIREAQVAPGLDATNFTLLNNALNAIGVATSGGVALNTADLIAGSMGNNFAGADQNAADAAKTAAQETVLSAGSLQVLTLGKLLEGVALKAYANELASQGRLLQDRMRDYLYHRMNQQSRFASFTSVGGQFDWEDFSLMAEYGYRSLPGYLGDLAGYFATASYRWGDLTPHFTYAVSRVRDRNMRDFNTVQAGVQLVSESTVSSSFDEYLGVFGVDPATGAPTSTPVNHSEYSGFDSLAGTFGATQYGVSAADYAGFTLTGFTATVGGAAIGTAMDPIGGVKPFAAPVGGEGTIIGAYLAGLTSLGQADPQNNPVPSMLVPTSYDSPTTPAEDLGELLLPLALDGTWHAAVLGVGDLFRENVFDNLSDAMKWAQQYDQDSMTLGVKYDWKPGVVAKLEVQRVEPKHNESGWMSNVNAGYELASDGSFQPKKVIKHIHLLSFALDASF